MLFRSPWKLITQHGSGGFTKPANRKAADGEPPGQLYHLADDPTESRNLWDANPEVVTQLMNLLDEQKRSDRSAPAP